MSVRIFRNFLLRGSVLDVFASQESIEDISSRVDQANIVNSQMDKKLKQFDKVNIMMNIFISLPLHDICIYNTDVCRAVVGPV